MARTVVHLMRHGEVNNPDGILYGRLPGYRLSDLGQAMAQEVANVLSREQRDVRAIIASPLLRAQETAEPTAAAFGLPVTTDDRITEAGNHFEGLALRSNLLQLAHPKYWRYLYNPLTPSWGEPYTAIITRMRAAIISAIDRAEGGEAVLVSHQLAIWTTRLFLDGMPLAHDPRQRQCSLASLTSLVFENRTLVGLSYREPAAVLVAEATDVTPGTSAADVNLGRSTPTADSGDSFEP